MTPEEIAFPRWQAQACVFSSFCLFSPCFLLLCFEEVKFLFKFPKPLQKEGTFLTGRSVLNSCDLLAFSISSFSFLSNETTNYFCTSLGISYQVKLLQSCFPIPCFDLSSVITLTATDHTYSIYMVPHSDYYLRSICCSKILPLCTVFENKVHKTGWLLRNFSPNTAEPWFERASQIIFINGTINNKTLIKVLGAPLGFIFACGEWAS